MKKLIKYLYAPLAFCMLLPAASRAEDLSELEAMIYVLNQQIADLKQQVTELQKAPPRETAAPVFKSPAPVMLGEGVMLGGSGAVAYFDTETDGQFPNNEFRIDEARLTVDARLADNAFFFAEVIIEQRESDNQDLRIGELYVDFEDLSRLWAREYPLTLRAGRFDIPFGEEYKYRDPIDNPLVSHSISDLWGIDEGLELFGNSGPFDLAVALQNGGYDSLHDGDPDKAITARLGFEPSEHLRLSASVMRTGDLDVEKDECAELWFGNAYVVPLGDPATTEEFQAELAELDARLSWERGHLAAALGCLSYDDDDTASDNSTDATYYYVEGRQDLTTKWFAAARYSAMHSDDGLPVLGQASYSPDPLALRTDDLWRLSLGLGYRYSEMLLLKSEYSFERGDRTDGTDVDQVDQFAVQAAFGF